MYLQFRELTNIKPAHKRIARWRKLPKPIPAVCNYVHRIPTHVAHFPTQFLSKVVRQRALKRILPHAPDPSQMKGAPGTALRGPGPSRRARAGARARARARARKKGRLARAAPGPTGLWSERQIRDFLTLAQKAQIRGPDPAFVREDLRPQFREELSGRRLVLAAGRQGRANLLPEEHTGLGHGGAQAEPHAPIRVARQHVPGFLEFLIRHSLPVRERPGLDRVTDNAHDRSLHLPHGAGPSRPAETRRGLSQRHALPWPLRGKATTPGAVRTCSFAAQTLRWLSDSPFAAHSG